MTDPFAALGLPRDASAQDVRAARRRLAKDHHPDAGGDDAEMAALNAAVNQALRAIADRDRPAPSDAAPVGRRNEPSDRGGPKEAGPTGRFVSDVPSFTVEALPAVTFEALLVVASWIGEVLDDDPPYRLEVLLREPGACWCVLDLVPDAGASTVSLQVASVDGRPAPTIESVRDVWIDQLNRLDWDGDDRG
jgi:curved DNA-binding protein CbpA